MLIISVVSIYIPPHNHRLTVPSVFFFLQSFTEVFILLRDDATSRDSEVEFTDDNQMMRVKPVRWNDRTLCVNAPGERRGK